jgi:hypothetical protein
LRLNSVLGRQGFMGACVLRSAILSLVALASANSVVAEEAQAWIAYAVAWGAKQERVKLPSAKGQGGVRYSTPFLRVALAAQEAKREDRTLEPASIPASLAAPELHLFAVLVPAQFLPGGGLVMGVPTDVTLVVAGTRLKPSSLEAQALPMSVAVPGGPTRPFEGRELKAVFPLSHPPAEIEAVVQYSWTHEGKAASMERKYKLDLQKTKW